MVMEQASSNLVEFDIRGQICPSTLLIALREINRYGREIKCGSVSLLFKTDNRDSIQTIPESAGNMGYAVEVTRHENYYAIQIS